jgi:hypothetical protein
VIEKMHEKGYPEGLIRESVAQLKEKSLDKFRNRHKIGLAIERENQDLLLEQIEEKRSR